MTKERLLSGLLLLAGLLATGCFGPAQTSIPPIAKIGLVAPFEGLYRATGYEALAAMRLAIQATADSPQEIALIPLALDSGDSPAQARRAMDKMAEDRALIGIVGPLVLADMDEGAGEMVEKIAGVPWHPFPGEPPLDRFLAEVVQRSMENQSVGIAVAGDNQSLLVNPDGPDGNLSTASTRSRSANFSLWYLRRAAPAQAADRSFALPVRAVARAADVAEGESVVWLGTPAAGAAFLVELRRNQPDALFFTTMAGDDPVFLRRALAGLAEDGLPLGDVWWTAWLDEAYPAWAEVNTPNSATAYAVFQATRTLMTQTPPPPKQLYFFKLSP